MWSKRLLTLVAAAACVVAHPQYEPQGGIADIVQNSGGYPTCDQYSDCVPLKQCINGYIDTTGAGSLDLRGGPKKTAEQLGYIICGIAEYGVDVCCKIPVDDYQDSVGGQIVSGGGAGGYVDGSSGGLVSGGGHAGGGAIGGGHAGGGAIGGGHAGGGAIGGGHAGGGAIGGGHAGGGAIGGGHAGGGAIGGGHTGVGGGDYVESTIVGAGAHGSSGQVVTGGGSAGAYDDGSIINAHNAGGVSGNIHSSGGVGGIHGSAPVSGPPYPACSAGLQCVEEISCNLYTGFIGDRIPLYEGQPFIEYKHCTTEYLPVGVCCQADPSAGGHVGGAGGHVGGAGGHVGGVGVAGAHSGNIGVGGGDGYVDQTIAGGAGGAIGGVGSGHVGGVGSGHVGGVGSGHVGGVGSGHVGGVGSGHVGGVGSGHVGGGGAGGAHSGNIGVAGGVVGGGDYGGGASGNIGVGGVAGAGSHSTGGISVQCGVYEECVLKEYCDKGWIVTDGAGLIDLRTKFGYNKCVDPEYPSSDAVCCRVDTAPEPLTACPNYEVCTDYQSCSPEGFVGQDLYSPQYSSGTECYKKSGFSALTGVCCKPSCPSDSVCIPESLCFGDIQDVSGIFGPYSPGGSWASCGLVGESSAGVCCQNPLPTEPTPTQCGVSQYAQTNSLKTRYKTPQITKLEADFGEFPWQAIVFFSNYTFRCGATIISDKHLLTAAHCVRDAYPEDFRVRVGEWQVNTFTEPYPYHDYDVAKITFHPKYRRGPEHNNLVVLELASPLTLAYNVNTACLPADGYTFPPGTRCFVSGWGKDSFVGDYQHILKKIDVPLVEHGYCRDLLRKTRLGRHFRLHSGFLCAGGEEGKDACTGDGGGPLVCLDANNQYVLAGVTSWGIGCGVKDVPGVYADVGKYVPWILETIQGVSGTQYGK